MLEGTLAYVWVPACKFQIKLMFSFFSRLHFAYIYSYMGVVMIKVFDASREDYSKLPTLVLIKTFTRLIPLILIPFLIPDASPLDEILTAKEKALDIDNLTNSPSSGSGTDDGGEDPPIYAYASDVSRRSDSSGPSDPMREVEMQIRSNNSLGDCNRRKPSDEVEVHI